MLPPMDARPLDVAIVGAGHNGLVAAAFLARAGLSVTAFERRDVAGGACVTEELWPGVRASPGAYLGGSGSHPGGAVTGAPGYLAARAVIEDLDGAGGG